MKKLFKFVTSFVADAADIFFREALATLAVTSIAFHYLGTAAGIITVVLSASLWSAWLTVLDAPGESIKWKLQWFKDPPSPDVVYETAARAARITLLVSMSVILDKVI